MKNIINMMNFMNNFLYDECNMTNFIKIKYVKYDKIDKRL